ncbi:MAG: 50S ribosomal protein L15 [Elusimicrobia bacterium HGW-Elusimicrobia-1]|jgi:large subunit ribosomal protein L15|nr:MAG: 50S ribosomal protein L15 [Elusimicrobia bacterium HGW-Elusimicrobia-1]
MNDNTLSNLKPAHGSVRKTKLIGRGGCHGRSSTRGGKGQTARSGDSSMNGFEGGQTPLLRLIPKSGFKNIFSVKYQTVSVGDINANFESGAAVDVEALRSAGLIQGTLPVKVLGDGEISKKIDITAHKFSKSAEEKIKSAGGSAVKPTIKKA